jgi:hypothetical protein
MPIYLLLTGFGGAWLSPGDGRRIGDPKEFLFGVRLLYSELRPDWIGMTYEGRHLIVNCDTELKKRVREGLRTRLNL